MKIKIGKLVEDKGYCEDVFNFFIKSGALKKTNPNFYRKYLNKSLSNLEFGNFVFF